MQVLLRFFEYPLSPGGDGLEQGTFGTFVWGLKQFLVSACTTGFERWEGHFGDAFGPAELLRVFQHRFVEQDGHGVVIQGVGLTAQAEGFQGDGATTGKGVEHPRGAPAEGFADELASSFKARIFALGHCLPGGKIAHQGQKLFPPFGVIGQERCKGCSAGDGQRFARPPDVERGDVPVADVFLPHGFFRDPAQREVGFEEAGVVLIDHFPKTL